MIHKASQSLSTSCKSLSAQHKAAQKHEDIENHFTKFQRDYRQYHIKSCNLHNFDETDFQIDCLTDQIVFNHTEKQIYILNFNNHELITSMKSISAEDETTDLMLIMPDQIMKEKHFLKNFNDDIRIEVSEFKYTNDLLSYV